MGQFNQNRIIVVVGDETKSSTVINHETPGRFVYFRRHHDKYFARMIYRITNKAVSRLSLLEWQTNANAGFARQPIA